jgi:hypothetical protein
MRATSLWFLFGALQLREEWNKPDGRGSSSVKGCHVFPRSGQARKDAMTVWYW